MDTHEKIKDIQDYLTGMDYRMGYYSPVADCVVTHEKSVTDVLHLYESRPIDELLNSKYLNCVDSTAVAKYLFDKNKIPCWCVNFSTLEDKYYKKVYDNVDYTYTTHSCVVYYFHGKYYYFEDIAKKTVKYTNKGFASFRSVLTYIKMCFRIEYGKNFKVAHVYDTIPYHKNGQYILFDWFKKTETHRL